jgi:hypothetical protein
MSLLLADFVAEVGNRKSARAATRPHSLLVAVRP